MGTDQTHPTYSEMSQWPVEKIRAHLETCAGTRDGECIPGMNALGAVVDEKKHEAALVKAGKKGAMVSGITATRKAPLRGSRCPTNRELR